jgi:hypothetical protein
MIQLRKETLVSIIGCICFRIQYIYCEHEELSYLFIINKFSMVHEACYSTHKC